MVTIHNLGFPRIGKKRELKASLESYWKKETSENELFSIAKGLRQENYDFQHGFDYLVAGDFSFYDIMLDMSFLLGIFPTVFQTWRIRD